jgi:multicomponent K+:H+ antiporter subunit C
MLLLLALGIGTLAGCGTWLLLRERSFDTVLGLTLLTYAVNLFIFAMGRVKPQACPSWNPAARPHWPRWPTRCPRPWC